MKKIFMLSLGLALLLLAGCDGALSIGGRSIGFQSGKFIFSDGFLQTTFPYPYEQTWAAAEKALSDLQAQDIKKTERIGRGEIRCLIREEKVTVAVNYLSKKETTVAVRVGLMANNIAAQIILEQVARNLK